MTEGPILRVKVSRFAASGFAEVQVQGACESLDLVAFSPLVNTISSLPLRRDDFFQIWHSRWA